MIWRRLPWLDDGWSRLAPLAARGVHAILLHGTRGVGKKSLALDFAEALLCAAPLDDGHGCGRCDECRLTAAFTHPDLRWVLPAALAERLLPQPEAAEEPATDSAPDEGEGEGRPKRASREIRVEQIRALADFLGIAAFRGGRRVIVLAPAETMNAVAANTLLKMLEEPPPETTFILVADTLDDVLPTIRSRCVLLEVPLPPADRCLSWLRAQEVADPAAALALASGAPMTAAADDAPVAEAQATLYRLLERGPSLTPAQVVESGFGRDAPVPAIVRLLQCWAFDLLLYRLSGSVRYHPARQATIGRLAAAARLDRLWHWIDALKVACAAREHPLNPRLVVESVLAGYIEVFDDRR